MAIRLLTILGEAGERAGFAPMLKTNTVKRRTLSLLHQGRMLYDLLPRMRDDRAQRLIEEFGKLLAIEDVWVHAFSAPELGDDSGGRRQPSEPRGGPRGLPSRAAAGGEGAGTKDELALDTDRPSRHESTQHVGQEQAPNGEFGRHAATRDSGAVDTSGFRHAK